MQWQEFSGLYSFELFLKADNYSQWNSILTHATAMVDGKVL